MIKLQTYDKQYLTKVSTNLTFQQNIFIISQETILHKLNLDIVGRYSSQCAACIEVHIHCPLNITQHITIIVQITGNKMSTPYVNIYIYAFSRHFYPKRLTVHSGYTFFCQYVCSLGIEPTNLCALLTQCSTTEPQENCV